MQFPFVEQKGKSRHIKEQLYDHPTSQATSTRRYTDFGNELISGATIGGRSVQDNTKIKSTNTLNIPDNILGDIIIQIQVELQPAILP